MKPQKKKEKSAHRQKHLSNISGDSFYFFVNRTKQEYVAANIPNVEEQGSNLVFYAQSTIAVISGPKCQRKR